MCDFVMVVLLFIFLISINFSGVCWVCNLCGVVMFDWGLIFIIVSYKLVRNEFFSLKSLKSMFDFVS